MHPTTRKKSLPLIRTLRVVPLAQHDPNIQESADSVPKMDTRESCGHPVLAVICAVTGTESVPMAAV